MSTPHRYRLITRSDMGGLVCAVLLEEMGVLGGNVFAHPKDVQDGKVAVTADDIITNLPYVAGCGLPRPLPRLPRQQLPVDDDADRLLS